VAPSDRSEGWKAAFTELAADHALNQLALDYARGWVHWLQNRGVLVSSAFADDLVANALGDTWRGVLSWEPGPEPKVSFLKHLKVGIRDRARRARGKARKYPTESLDAHDHDDEDDSAAALWIEAETALAATVPAADVSKRLSAVEMFDRVRMCAGRDPEIAKLLDEIRAGNTERADLMRAMGMSDRRFDSIRRRLDRLLLELPSSMLERVSGAPPGPSTAAFVFDAAVRRMHATGPPRQSFRGSRINSSAIPKAPFSGVARGLSVGVPRPVFEPKSDRSKTLFPMPPDAISTAIPGGSHARTRVQWHNQF
jgi:hypothetical protein